jgi:hypothetical protein
VFDQGDTTTQLAEHNMADIGSQVWQLHRPKLRPSVWACYVHVGSKTVFDSRWLSLRLWSESAGNWLAGLVADLHAQGILPSPWCHASQPNLQPIVWTGEMDDDCHATLGEFQAHAEWQHGPRRGGHWYCQVRGPLGQYFHTADRNDIQPRNGVAARWLCEVVMRAASISLLNSYAD